jgi:hypothetical protein
MKPIRKQGLSVVEIQGVQQLQASQGGLLLWTLDAERV